jgi:hypothetical protein
MVSRPVVRTVFVVLALALAVGVTLQNLRFDAGLSGESRAATALDSDFTAASVALADLKAVEAGFVAAGQSPEFWTSRATDILDQLDGAIAGFAATSRAASAAPHYDAAATVLQNLTKIDGRAREQVTRGERFLAADLVFLDGLDANRRLAQELTAARDLERADADQRTTRIVRWRLAMNALALGVGVLLVLLSSGSRRASVPAAEPEQPGRTATIMGDLRSVEPAPPLSPAPASAVDVSAAAALCVDLARLLNVHDLPALLGRAADVLDAKGLVLWMADPGRTYLRPTLAHGYTERVLQRLGTLSVDADNVTSLAFRTLELQVVPGPPNGHGAIAAPLITSHGCTGVLAAEISNAAGDDSRRALVRIIAAQLATVVASSEAAGSDRRAHG